MSESLLHLWCPLHDDELILPGRCYDDKSGEDGNLIMTAPVVALDMHFRWGAYYVAVPSASTGWQAPEIWALAK